MLVRCLGFRRCGWCRLRSWGCLGFRVRVSLKRVCRLVFSLLGSRVCGGVREVSCGSGSGLARHPPLSLFPPLSLSPPLSFPPLFFPPLFPLFPLECCSKVLCLVGGVR